MSEIQPIYAQEPSLNSPNEVIGTTVPPEVAGGRSLQEAIASNDITKFDPLLKGNLQSDFVSDETRNMYSNLSSQAYQTIFLEAMKKATTQEDQIKTIQRFSRYVNNTPSTARTFAFINFLINNKNNDYSIDSYKRFETEENTDYHTWFKSNIIEPNQDNTAENIQHHLDMFAASHPIEGMPQALWEVLKVAFIPGQDAAFNLAAGKVAKEFPNPPDLGWFDWTTYISGEGRTKLREWVSQLSAADREQFVIKLIDNIDKSEKDPVLGLWINKLNIKDFSESVLDPEVLSGTVTGPNQVDRWVSNIGSILDIFWIGTAAKKVAKAVTIPLESTFKNISTNPIIRETQKVRTKASEDVAQVIPNTVDPVDSSMFPKPSSEGVRVIPNPPKIPDVSLSVKERQAALEEKLNQSVSNAQGELFTTTQKQQAIETVQLEQSAGNAGVINISASVVTPIGEDGRLIKSVFGATEGTGWKGETGLKELSGVLETIDNVSNKVTILVKQKDGTLKELTTIPQHSPGFWTADTIEGAVKADVGLKNAKGTIKKNVEFYYQVETNKFFTPEDKALFGEGNNVKFFGRLANMFLPANIVFKSKFYRAWLTATLTETSLKKTFNQMARPFYNLSNRDKKVVHSIIEFAESFGEKNNKSVTVTDLLTHFPDLTQKQLDGFWAMRATQDSWYKHLNDMLYKNWHNQGFKSAVGDTKTSLHGKVLTKEEALSLIKKDKNLFNPVTDKGKVLNEDEIKRIYEAGGGLMRPDDVIRSKVDSSLTFTHAIIDPEEGFIITELERNVLPYHHGYFPKIYTDNYMVFKKPLFIIRNGKKIKDPVILEQYKEPIGMAGSRKFVDRKVKSLNARSRGNSEYSYQLVNELSHEDRKAYTNSLINRDRTLFGDRDYVRLSNFQGKGFAQLLDPYLALEQAIESASSVLGKENLLKRLKSAFKTEYIESKKLLKDSLKTGEFDTLSSADVMDKLKTAQINAVDKTVEKELKKAITYWDHIRYLEGTDSSWNAELRKFMLNQAYFFNSPKLEGMILRGTPLKRTMKLIFGAWIATRPPRQLVLQSAQLFFLNGLDPTYIMTGRVFKDMLLLKHSMLVNNKMIEGVLPDAAYKLSGFTKQEFNIISKELENSGIMSSVDIHAFGGGSVVNKVQPIAKNALELAGQKVSYVGSTVYKGLLEAGFNTGERINLMGTYLIALRRYLKNNPKLTIKSLTKEDWKSITYDTSNLSLGMISANSIKVQRGLLSVPLQFTTYSYKAALAMIGMNPSISRTEAIKIIASQAALFGLAAFGAREAMDKWLGQWELDNNSHLSPATKEYAVDVLKWGIIDRIINDIGAFVSQDDWSELDISSLSPGIGGGQLFVEKLLEASTTGDWGVYLGPTGSLVGNIAPAMGATVALWYGDQDSTVEKKLSQSLDLFASSIFPLYNDINLAQIADTLGEWQTRSGYNTNIRAQWNAIIAKGIFSIPTKESSAQWSLLSESDKHTALVQRVEAEKKYLATIINRYHEGMDDVNGLITYFKMIGNLAMALPERDRFEYYKLMVSVTPSESILATLSKNIGQGKVDMGVFTEALRHNISIPPEERDKLLIVLDTYNKQLDSANELMPVNIEETKNFLNQTESQSIDYTPKVSDDPYTYENLTPAMLAQMSRSLKDLGINSRILEPDVFNQTPKEKRKNVFDAIKRNIANKPKEDLN
jgi:hypothetical protein